MFILGSLEFQRILKIKLADKNLDELDLRLDESRAAPFGRHAYAGRSDPTFCVGRLGSSCETG